MKEDTKYLLTPYMIRKEYERTHNEEQIPFDPESIPVEDRKLSMNDFSRKMGWIK